MGPDQVWLEGVLIKRGNLETQTCTCTHTHTHTHTHTGKMPGEDEDRDHGDASSSQGMPKMACKPLEARERSGIDSLSEPLGPNPAGTWTSDFQPPDCETVNFCC